MADRNDRGAPLWSRLAHEALGMPIPAVYLPQRSLPAEARGMWGFEPIVTRDAANPIPYAHRDGFTLVADIRGRASMNVLIVPADLFTGTGEPARADDPQLFSSGRFAEPHPRPWKKAAYAAESLLAVIGPDDIPALNPYKLRLLDPMDLRDLRRGVSTLWIFSSAIAALHLVRP